jgi:CubicO group peptidase (beta-lactamase class C family)
MSIAMRRILVVGGLTIVALLLWALLVGGNALGGWLRQPLAPRGDAPAFAAAASAKLDKESRGNAAFALVEHGRVVATHFQSIGVPVNGDSLFQVASLSKWVTAWGVMKLVEQGRLDLDAPVSRYLKRWELPASLYNSDVTVRRILSHTAGFTDGLGYGGFAPGQPIQTLEQSLTRAADRSPGADGAVIVGYEPGTDWRYSGGGYTLLQLLVEEASGESFNDYMRTAVLIPLGMTQSTFVLDDATRPRVATFYAPDGAEATHFNFTALAAASLYTSVNDLVLFVQAQSSAPDGALPGRGVLKPETVLAMRAVEASRYGAPIWGLGQILYAPNTTGGLVVGHDGDNAPAINTTARVDPDTGDGIIVLETGTRLLATEIGGEWVFWNAGQVDVLTVLSEVTSSLIGLLIGWAVIIVVATFVALRWRRRPATAP